MAHVYAGLENYPTNATLPDDSDDMSAASVNVPFAAALDRTTYLKNKISNYLVWEKTFANDEDGAIQSSTTSTSYPSWSDLSGAGNVVLLTAADGYDVLAGDKIEITISFLESLDITSEIHTIRLVYSLNSSTIVQIPGSRIFNKETNSFHHAHTMTANFVLTNPSSNFWVALQHKLSAVVTGTICSPYTYTIKCFRSL